MVRRFLVQPLSDSLAVSLSFFMLLRAGVAMASALSFGSKEVEC
ncbi:hypothetical protein L681_00170 [Stenotrophomonas maltophilia MF89]|nr:hypothetical protein L681_00170 [Stenotrophomonas maltophilia MF89]